MRTHPDQILAEATGTPTRRAPAARRLRRKVADGKDALAEAGLAGAPFTMADGWLDDGAVSIRMYTPTRTSARSLTEIGLENPWTAEGDKDYGLAQTDVEGLTKIRRPPLPLRRERQRRWRRLHRTRSRQRGLEAAAVRRRADVTRLPDGIWMFGGPASGAAFIDATSLTALTRLRTHR